MPRKRGRYRGFERRMKFQCNTRMRGLTVLTGTAISVGLLMVTPAHAATGSAHADLSNPRLAASARAKQIGKPVQVSSLTTANSTTVANPNGSFTTDTTVLDYDEVQAGCPAYANYNSVTDLGVGYYDFDPCYGAYRSFIVVSLGGLNSSDVITSSTFTITSDFSAENSCDESSQTVDLDWTGAISADTDWNNQPGINHNSSVPAPMSAANVESDGNSDGSTCSGGVPVNFPVTSSVSYFASQNMGSVTVGMYGNESVSPSLERFNVGTASLITTYNLAPSVLPGV